MAEYTGAFQPMFSNDLDNLKYPGSSSTTGSFSTNSKATFLKTGMPSRH